MACKHCALCGTRIIGLRRRLFCPKEGLRFISTRCKATPFVHAYLLSSLPAAKGKQVLCIPCVNWKRRAEQGTLRRTSSPMLQLDQLILFLLQPGRHPEPDFRCMERLVAAARQPDNPLRRPPPPFLFAVLLCV